MEKMLFTKFNSLRAPLFRTGIIISETDGVKSVRKFALGEDSKAFIEDIYRNTKAASEIYEDIDFLECKMDGDSCIFPFVNGASLLESIDFENGSIDDICAGLEKDLAPLWRYKQENILSEFKETEEFKAIFGNSYTLTGQQGLKISNLDPLPGNFAVVDGKIVCIDYEWTVRFPVPIGFPRFRAYRYLYEEQHVNLASKTDLNGFLAKFGFTDDMITCFLAMEEAFQQYVHGEGRKYIYTMGYIKNRITLESLKNAYDLVPKLSEDIAMLNNLKLYHEKVIEDKDRAITDRDNIIVDKDKVIEVRDRIIEDKDRAIVDREKIISDQQTEIERRESVIANQQLAISSRDEAIAYRDGIIAAQGERLTKIKRGIKNPFYGTYLFGRYIAKKAYQNIGPKDVCYMRKKYGRHWKDFIEKEKAEQNPPNEYEKWISVVESRYSTDEVFTYNPKISVIIPVYNVEDVYLKACIDSVLNQTYQNFEICISDDNSTFKNVKPTLKAYAAKDKRVKVVFRETNGHISENSNTALKEATGEYIALLDCDDTLSPNAFYEVVKYLNVHPDCDYVYSDEDKLTDDGIHRHNPHFKPDWSPDSFMCVMYTCHLSVFRKSLIDEIGGFRKGVEGSQDYDLVLRVMEKTNNIGHIAKILYHWRERVGSTANDISSKSYVNEATEKAKTDALERRGIKGHLEWVEGSLQCRIVYDVIGNPKVSIVIPSKDNYDVLKRCIDSIYERTAYKNFEIIVVDNGSCDEVKAKIQALAAEHGFKYEYQPAEFNFSGMCNCGAANTDGELILFLNDDIEIQGSDWLERLIGHAQQSHVGAVGCKLYYPDGHTIQHNGVLNLQSPVHALYRFDDSNANYYYSRNLIDYNYTIVTAAALMVSRSKFDEIGGFDETLPIAYNDVELCFKLVEHGYYNVLRTDVALIHHESISRGLDNNSEEKLKRLDNELKRLYEMHPRMKMYDPCYNINLTQTNVDYSFNTELIGYDSEEATISHSVDSMDFSGNKVEIKGWAFEQSHRAESPFVRVDLVARSGAVPADLKLFRTARRDVVDLMKLPEETAENKYGYICTWTYEGNEVYYLKFTSDVSSLVYTIDISVELRKERERRRKYRSEAEMKAADDPYRKEDDRFYLNTLGKDGYEAIVRERLNCSNVDYDVWREHHLLSESEAAKQRTKVFEQKPLISIAVPLYRTPENFLREMIDSVQGQTYGNWELCLADGSMNDSVEPIVKEYMQSDPRIKYARLDSNLGISENTNEAIKLSSGEYVALLDHDDFIEADALFEVVKRINETNADIVYTDEDKCNTDGNKYYDPNLKPDFNKEYLFGCNYITHFFVVRKTVVDKVGLLDPAYDGSQDYDFILRCTQEAERIEHIARVLYHWRCHMESMAMNIESKMYCYDAGRRAVEAALKREGEKSFEVGMPVLGLYRANRNLDNLPRIQIITIPENREWVEKNLSDDVITAVYTNLEEFFKAAIPDDAEYVLYLGVKITGATENWLRILAVNCARGDVGAVCGRIVGNDGRTLHSGLVVQTDGRMRDLYVGEAEQVPGFNGRNILAQDVDASIPACLLIRSAYIRTLDTASDTDDFSRSVLLGEEILKANKRVLYLPEATIYGEDTKEWISPGNKFPHTRELYNPNYDPDGLPYSLKL